MWLVSFPLVAAAAPEVDTPWDGTRWFVEIEETTPAPVELSAEENFSFRTRGLQMQTVLSCPSASPFGKRIEVTCRVEAIAIRATPRTLDPSDALNPNNQKVLDNMVARLHRTRVVFTVNEHGRVTTADLPDVPVGNRRESESREILRRLFYDAVAGFSLDKPDALKEGSEWIEKSSVLMRAPSQPALLGNTKTIHKFSIIDNVPVVESSGEGVFTSPYTPWEFGYEGRIMVSGSGAGGGGKSSGGGLGPASSTSPSAAGDGRLVSGGPQASAATPTDISFEGALTAIAVLDSANELQERIWRLNARPTASSIGNMQGNSLYYAGHIRRLDKMEAVEMGVTEIIAPLGYQIEGVSPWVVISTF